MKSPSSQQQKAAAKAAAGKVTVAGGQLRSPVPSPYKRPSRVKTPSPLTKK